MHDIIRSCDIAYKVPKKHAFSMRTTIDIPDDIMERAIRASASRSKRDAVLAGLDELIRKCEREELRRLAGKIDLSLDLGRSRSNKR